MKEERGFTLTEIIVALAILGIITATAMSVVNWRNFRKARTTSAEMQTIVDAGVRYYWTNAAFPTRWSQLAGDLPPKIIDSPTNPYGSAYTFTSNGPTFSVSTTVPAWVDGTLGLKNASRSGNVITAGETVRIDNMGGAIYEKDRGWAG